MPSTDKRKSSAIAIQRMKEKYQLVDDHSHPYHVMMPVKADTAAMRQIMDNRNYVCIMTQIDKNKYILMKIYIYCEEDIWICGEGFTINQNPDKKIWIRTMCTVSKNPCICEDENNSNEFLTACPNCHNIMVAIKNTPIKCESCKTKYTYHQVNSFPYFKKLECKLCPREIGWEKCQAIKNLLQTRLSEREQHVVEELSNKMKNLIDEKTLDLLKKKKG